MKRLIAFIVLFAALMIPSGCSKSHDCADPTADEQRGNLTGLRTFEEGTCGSSVQNNSAAVLSCIATAPTGPFTANQAVNVTLQAYGGQAPYSTAGIPTFGSFTSIVVNANSSGNLNSVLTVIDAAGTAAVCSWGGNGGNNNNTGPVSVALAAIPSATRPIGNAITVKATPTGFSATPNYVFTTSEPNISIVQNGAEATVTANDSLYHQFVVTVSATNSAQSAVSSIQLSFIGDAIACSLDVTKQTAIIGETLTVTVKGPSNEIMKVLEFNPGTGGSNLSGLFSPAQIKYASTGLKTIRVKAHRSFDHAPCNGDGYLEAHVQINGPIACSAQLSPNPSVGGDIVAATAFVAPDAGSGNIKLIDVIVSSLAGKEFVSQVSDLEQQIKLNNAGTYQVQLKVRDEGDALKRTATCSTTHTVSSNRPLCTASFAKVTTGPLGTYMAPINSARPNEPVSILVNSSLSSGRIEINPGAPVLYSPAPANVNFPVLANNIRYAGPGLKAATVTVVNTQNNASQSCGAYININSGLSCTLAGPSLFNIFRVQHLGYMETDIWSGNKPQFTASTQNASGSLNYKFDDGDGNISNASSTAVSYSFLGNYKKGGFHVAKATITDGYDAVGNSCELNAGANKEQWFHLHELDNRKLGGYRCYAEITNLSAASQTVAVYGGTSSIFQSSVYLAPGETKRSQYFGVEQGGCNDDDSSSDDSNGRSSNSCLVKIKTYAASNPKGSLAGKVCLKKKDKNLIKCWDITDF